MILIGTKTKRPEPPPDETVIYETHVKGLTQRHPEVPEQLRGTYAGLAHPAITGYLVDLGITAVELLPVHQFVQDSTCKRRDYVTTGDITASVSSVPTGTTAARGRVADKSTSSNQWSRRYTVSV